MKHTRFPLALATMLAILVSAGFAFGQEKKETKQPEALKVGDKAPDFKLESFDDKHVQLSDRFGKEGKPVVLLFSRANW